MEQHVFSKARSKDEYLSFVARLIIHVREMSKIENPRVSSSNLQLFQFHRQQKQKPRWRKFASRSSARPTVWNSRPYRSSPESRDSRHSKRSATNDESTTSTAANAKYDAGSEPTATGNESTAAAGKHAAKHDPTNDEPANGPEPS